MSHDLRLHILRVYNLIILSPQEGSMNHNEIMSTRFRTNKRLPASVEYECDMCCRRSGTHYRVRSNLTIYVVCTYCITKGRNIQQHKYIKYKQYDYIYYADRHFVAISGYLRNITTYNVQHFSKFITNNNSQQWSPYYLVKKYKAELVQVILLLNCDLVSDISYSIVMLMMTMRVEINV